jgi:FKBP-type peptidyl-prolyl cis-trans isomerase
MLIDGRVFDESAAGDPFEFTVGDISEGVIMGWHFGLARFREGEKGRLIIPYPLAYGPQGRIDNNIISIPPYETLVFEIEVVDVVSRSSTSGID